MSDPFTPPFTETQQKVVAIVPKVTASFSIIGSLFIVQDVLRMPQTTIYHRIMLAMSTMDFIFAVKSFASTWPIPEETRFIWGNIGTTETCEITGFLGHGSSLTSALYNGSLSLYFFFSLVLMYREEAVRRFEWLLHAVPFGVAWGVAAAGLPLDIYNPVGWTCWFGSFPPGCESNPRIPCQRGGDNVDAYRWAFQHAELWSIFALAGFTLFAIYRSVQKRERAMEHFGVRDSSAGQLALQQHRFARRVATQAILYQTFFFLTWIFPMMTFVVRLITGHIYFPMGVMTVIFTPLQGFFDALIYVRPRYLKYREQQRRAALPSDSENNNWRTALGQAISLNPDNDFQGEIVLNPNDGDTVNTASRATQEDEVVQDET